MADKLQPTVATPITLPEFIRSCIRTWHLVNGGLVVREAIAVLWAQYICETGGMFCYGWNIGNVKHVDGDGHDYHCLKGVWEGLSPPQATRVVQSGDATYDMNEGHQKQVHPNVAVIFNPPHPATRFICYPDLDEAMGDHLVLLAKKRFASVWPAVLTGDYVAFAKALKSRGYFTATAETYAAGMRHAYSDAMKSRVFDEELATFTRAEDSAPAEVTTSPVIHPPVFDDDNPVTHNPVDPDDPGSST